MSFVESSERREAQEAIDWFLNRHRLHVYREVSPDAIAAQAKHLAKCVKILHRGDYEKVSRELQKIADDVAAMEFDDPKGNGHHERAAEEIRHVCEELVYENCPWSDLVHLLRTEHVQRHLAVALWEENRQRSWQWSADLQRIVVRVWGDEALDDNTLRATASRLSSWLNDEGVENKIEVKAAAEQPCIACTILSVNQEKIDATLARREKKTRDELDMARAARNRG